jgi:hypothetical protein
MADSGFYVAPSLSVGRAYDDNLFYSSTDRESDSIWRISPAVEAGYKSEAFTIAGYYTLDAERYLYHSDLNSNVARRNAALDIGYRPTQRLKFSMYGDYINTNTPAELAPGTGLALGRTRAKLFTVNPSLAYQFNAVTTGTVGYAYTRNELADSPDADIRTDSLELDRRIGERDTLKTRLESGVYYFGVADTITSRVFSLGWTHDATPSTTYTLAAGPRDTEGTVVPEAMASLQHVTESGSIALNYFRTQTEVIGQVEPVGISSIGFIWNYSPSRLFDIQLAPSRVRDWNDTSHAIIYRLNLNVSYKVDETISLVSAYEYDMQQGNLDGVGEQNIRDNVIYIGLVFAFNTSRNNVFEKRTSSPFETLWPAPQH